MREVGGKGGGGGGVMLLTSSPSRTKLSGFRTTSRHMSENRQKLVKYLPVLNQI